MTQGGSPAMRQEHYYVPQPMPWPIMGSTALFLMILGGVFVMNGASAGWISLALGVVVLLYMLLRWFGDVIRESEGGKYGSWEDVSFRWGMSWFIFSEVMFFAGFFGALFWARAMSVPDLSSLLHQEMLWPGFKGLWPSAGPGFAEEFTPMGALGIPAINTLLLLSSGVTLTYAHWGLVNNQRGKLNLFLFLTIVLGAIFLGLQIYEYAHAYSALNLKLSTGVYGSTFFMLTGFHGFHVTLGAIMLTVILFRCLAGHFKSDHHFAFEAVAWYWHFVDVVWLLLFIVVYWL
ncbi:MAG: MFS transporter [Betaproteobacteria bacterium RIFCSPLOWO2_02_67_12]|nr:MAG: MFS transporter [Betaproteobacteria bacterium RIFCSPLOWO2_02_67_12]OGA27500.1 MAG: MFS transporter [Betaproteobacteria bacterium RIFCSPLOWO2_02_FULL_68_150]OGA66130.1 MAG: MFS transporter [Betaproteobacteria bacterium RIFCSPLOWO2_12_FULL_67_28]